MSIFRRRAATPATAASEADTGDRAEARGEEQERAVGAADESAAPDVVDVEDDVDVPGDRSAGPFDASEVDGLGDRLDLGSLWLAPVTGAELRLEVDQASENVTAIQIIIGESAAQVQVFAAPRSGGVWREIRSEIAKAIDSGGGTVSEVPGSFGPELHVSMPQAGPDGRTVFAPARFVGIDGPRWFLRAVLSGPAAVDDAIAGQLAVGLRAVVVNRGSAPMAPREVLPLHLPQPRAEQEAAPADPDNEPREEPYADPDLNPFERGPEITEVR